jgi:hypothetical protein
MQFAMISYSGKNGINVNFYPVHIERRNGDLYFGAFVLTSKLQVYQQKNRYV